MMSLSDNYQLTLLKRSTLLQEFIFLDDLLNIDKNNSKWVGYNQKMPQSPITDQNTAMLGRDMERGQLPDSQNTIKVKQSALSSAARWLQN